MALTFLVYAANDVVDVVREEPAVVEHCGQEGGDGTGTHLFVVFMLIHLQRVRVHSINDINFITVITNQFWPLQM